MLCCGSRILHHIRECNYNHHHQQQQNLGSGLGFCSSRIVQLSSFMLRPVSVRYHIPQRFASFSTKSPRSIPIRSDCLSPWREHCKFGTKKLYDESQREDDCDLSAEGSSSVAGGIVALGKFDALHIGHRELASQASKVGAPYLLSFVGMAEVFGWEPRAPIVAKCDRKRVLSSWAPYCGNMTPAEFQIEFSSVRHLTPQQFVEKLSKELRVSGVVAGENYRFGYKAAGDASELVRLCENYGMHAYIIKSVMDKNEDSRKMAASDYKDRGQVSSTRVHRALAVGDLNYVSELLGRRHRLVMMVNDLEELTSTSNSKCRVSAPKSCLLNLPPKEGLYENCFLFFGDESPVSCRVFIDTMRIHVEMDDIGLCNFDHSQDFQFLGIEFGGLES